MWVFTTDGMYSARVDEFCEDGEVVIRARAEQDLQNFLIELTKLGYVAKPEILQIEHADYLFRVIVDKIAWGDYLQDAAMSIDYGPGGFKGTIDHADKARHVAYYKVWSAMCTFQESEIQRRYEVEGSNE